MRPFWLETSLNSLLFWSNKPVAILSKILSQIASLFGKKKKKKKNHHILHY
ncbi:hypothetical protein HanIR_Chr15g0743571 [Helianthus annuus]|nr:hypothetical protein HanIR_Chr15g0743571 [Helianthus annuus]